MGLIHCIGTAHLDPRGRERLEIALDVEKPDIITLETSEEQLDYFARRREENIEKATRMISQADIDPQVAALVEKYVVRTEVYEINVCREYSKRTGVPIVLVDGFFPELAEKDLEDRLARLELFLNMLKDPRKARQFTPALVQASIDGQYRVANRVLVGEDFPDPEKLKKALEIGYIGERDKIMSERILLALPDDGSLIHIGGMGHLYPDRGGRTLYERLKHRDIKRTLLPFYDFVAIS